MCHMRRRIHVCGRSLHPPSSFFCVCGPLLIYRQVRGGGGRGTCSARISILSELHLVVGQSGTKGKSQSSIVALYSKYTRSLTSRI